MNRLLALASAFVFSVAFTVTRAEEPAFERNTSTVISSQWQISALATPCSRQGFVLDDRWTPLRGDIALVEAALPSILGGALLRANATAKVSEYYRQYAGVIVAGQRRIYVNGFHKQVTKHAPLDWRANAIQFCDGGTLFFGVLFDPATGTFEGFEFNGAI